MIYTKGVKFITTKLAKGPQVTYNRFAAHPFAITFEPMVQFLDCLGFRIFINMCTFATNTRHQIERRKDPAHGRQRISQPIWRQRIDP